MAPQYLPSAIKRRFHIGWHPRLIYIRPSLLIDVDGVSSAVMTLHSPYLPALESDKNNSRLQENAIRAVDEAADAAFITTKKFLNTETLTTSMETFRR